MKVTVIIPNYNGKHFLKPCLDSLKKQTMQDFHTLVVDNASSDGSLDFIKEHFPEIEVLRLSRSMDSAPQSTPAYGTRRLHLSSF